MSVTTTLSEFVKSFVNLEFGTFSTFCADDVTAVLDNKEIVGGSAFTIIAHRILGRAAVPEFGA